MSNKLQNQFTREDIEASWEIFQDMNGDISSDIQDIDLDATSWQSDDGCIFKVVNAKGDAMPNDLAEILATDGPALFFSGQVKKRNGEMTPQYVVGLFLQPIDSDGEANAIAVKMTTDVEQDEESGLWWFDVENCESHTVGTCRIGTSYFCPEDQALEYKENGDPKQPVVIRLPDGWNWSKRKRNAFGTAFNAFFILPTVTAGRAMPTAIPLLDQVDETDADDAS